MSVDINHYYENLERALKKLSIILIDDFEEIKKGAVMPTIALMRKLLFNTSSSVMKNMLLRGCASHVSDRKLAVSAFDLLRETVKFSPGISIDQFFSQAFITHKILVLIKVAEYVAHVDRLAIRPAVKTTFVIPSEALSHLSSIELVNKNNAMNESGVILESSEWAVADYFQVSHGAQDLPSHLSHSHISSTGSPSKSIGGSPYITRSGGNPGTPGNALKRSTSAQRSSRAISNTTNTTPNHGIHTHTEGKQTGHTPAHTPGHTPAHSPAHIPGSKYGMRTPTTGHGHGHHGHSLEDLASSEEYLTPSPAPVSAPSSSSTDPKTPKTPKTPPVATATTATTAATAATAATMTYYTDIEALEEVVTGTGTSPSSSTHPHRAKQPTSSSSGNNNNSSGQEEMIYTPYTPQQLHQLIEDQVERSIQARVDTVMQEVCEKYDFIISRMVNAINEEFVTLGNRVNSLEDTIAMMTANSVTGNAEDPMLRYHHTAIPHLNHQDNDHNSNDIIQ